MVTPRKLDKRQQAQLDIVNWLLMLTNGHVQLQDIDFENGGVCLRGGKTDCETFGLVFNMLMDTTENQYRELNSYGG